MKFFEHYFKDTAFNGAEEVKVLCPFHADHSPSASVNTKDDLFHCWVCNVGYNEQQFMAKLNNITLAEANKALSKFNEVDHSWYVVEKAGLWANAGFLDRVMQLGFTKEAIEELNLGLVKDEYSRFYLGFPVFFNGILMDVRRYNLLKIDKVPKMVSNKGAEAGFVIPYDTWKDTKETTYIFEGEKDMTMARSLGINAITLTGGAGATPNRYVLSAFKGRDVVICYDNDDAGRDGALNLSKTLRKLVTSVKYVNLSPICVEDKEDFWDFINKYKKTAKDFYGLPLYSFPEDLTQEPKEQYTTVLSALEGNFIRKKLKTAITVSAEYGDAYAVPLSATITKMTDDTKGTMFQGETKEWVLDESTPNELLELIEVSASKAEVSSKIKMFASADAKGTAVSIHEFKTVFKTKVIDKDGSNENVSLDLYSFDQLLVGKQYVIDYVIVPHPNKNQRVVSVASSVEEIDTFTDFKVNIGILSEFITKGTVKERLDKLYQSAKHHIAKHLRFNMWLMADLVFNSLLEIDFDGVKRGALDVFVLGDTQAGKSETTSKLVDLYNFGHFLSLKTSTTVGLIGGSNKVDGSWLNTIGAIPRQHTRLVVMEEFSGAKPEFIKTMTDIRSSGQLRLARAAGELNVPCRLRMITISNPINDENGHPRFLSTFPNGVSPLMELIKSAEDVARYDGFLLVEKPSERLNPFSIKLQGTPIPAELYNHKIQWVATRKNSDVIYADDSDSYIWERAQYLNEMFESNFPLFGTTTDQKLARFAVALAALIVNTDSSFEKVVVTREIVDYVVNFLISIYDNPVFKLKEYKQEFENYSKLSPEELQSLQDLYPKNATTLDFLVNQSSTSRTNLRTVSGLENDQFTKVFNRLVRDKFIRLQGEMVYPTQKYREGMGKINKNIHIDTGIIEVKGGA